MQDDKFLNSMTSHAYESLDKLIERLKKDLSSYSFIPVLAMAYKNDNFVFIKEDGVRNDDFKLSNYIADLYLSFQKDKELTFPDEKTTTDIFQYLIEIVKTNMLVDMCKSPSIENDANTYKSICKYTERSFFTPIFIMIFSLTTDKKYYDFFYKKTGFNILDLNLINQILQVIVSDRINKQITFSEMLQFSLDDIMNIVDRDIKKEYQIPLTEVRSIIEYFITEKSNNSSYLPRTENPFNKNPFFKYKDKYICSNPLQLVKQMHNILETELSSDATIWENYATSRGKALENTIVMILKDVFPNAKIYQNLKYYPEDGKRHETDIVIDTGVYLLIIEAKAGRFQENAKLGNEKLFNNSVTKLIEKAHEQCQCTYNYFFKNENVKFEADNGTVLFEKDKYIKVYMLTVTLENLDSLTSDIYKTVPVFEMNPILSFSLYDLYIVLDILQTAEEFLLYLDAKQKTVKKGTINSSNEIDYLSNFLVMGLQFENIPDAKNANVIEITDYDDAIEKYYFGEVRKKPTLSRGVGINILLQKLRQSGSCYSEVICKELLMLKLNLQKDIVKKFDCITKRAIRGGRHDCSFLVESSNIGVSFICYHDDKTISDTETFWKGFAYQHLNTQNVDYWFYVIAIAKPNKVIKIGYVKNKITNR